MLNAYYYKWKFIWITWILRVDNGPTLYYDNKPTIKIVSDGIIYFRLSLSKKTAQSKMMKFLERRQKDGYKEYSNAC